VGHAHTIFRECGSDGRSQRAHGETHSAKPELFLQMQSGDISDSPRASIEFWGSSSLFSLSRLLPLLAPKNNAQVFALNAAKSRSALWGRLHFTRATSRASCERRASGECVWEHHLSFLSFFSGASTLAHPYYAPENGDYAIPLCSWGRAIISDLYIRTLLKSRTVNA
jgi:hypothetical protein